MERILSDMNLINIYEKETDVDNVGRIIFTTIYKHRFLLINYDVRDLGRIDFRNGKQFFSELYRRDNDSIKHADGTETGRIHLWYAISAEMDILQARFVQDEYEAVKLFLVGKKGADHKAIADRVKEGVEKRMKYKTSVDVEWVNSIPLDSNGKLRMIVNNIKTVDG